MDKRDVEELRVFVKKNPNIFLAFHKIGGQK
jgi:hypothetical protein